MTKISASDGPEQKRTQKEEIRSFREIKLMDRVLLLFGENIFNSLAALI